MFNSFRSKLTSTFFIMILAILVVTGLILSLILKDYYISEVKSSLVNEAQLIAQITSFYDEQTDLNSFLQKVADTTEEDTNSRVTIIDEKGVVLADSIFDAQAMDLHNTRPEFLAALSGQIGDHVRLSDTADVKMLYLAIPFANGEVTGAIRVAKPLNEVQNIYHNILYLLVIGIIFTGLIAFAFSIFIARRFAQPVQELTETFGDIAQGNLERRVTYKRGDELGILAEAVNNMTDYLERTINEISQVKNRLEILLENTVNGILFIDTRGKVTYANPVAAELLAGRDFIGRSYVEIIKNYELITMIDEVVKSLKPIRAEIIMHTNGEKTIEVNVVPIINDSRNENNGVLLVLNDITELKRLEQVRKDFVGNVSHELKTPMATISGFAETLMAEGNDSENIKEFSSIIYDEAQHLSQLISRLLELSRLESGKLELQYADVVLSKVINSAIINIKKHYSDSYPNIKVEMMKDDITVKGDYELIRQVVTNLLENAINFSPFGEEIVIEVTENDIEVKVTITDQGEGIPSTDLPRIFERFYRVDRARSKKTGGTGLGLSIVKHLVENHGGTVGVTSNIGMGSTFFFTLPK